MPCDPLAIAGHLAKEVRTPGDHVFAQQVRNTGHDARMRQQIVHPAIAEMSRADGIAVAAGSQRPGQQSIEVAANASHLIFTENPHSFQVSVAIEGRDLLHSQPLRILHGRRMKAQVALHLAQLFSGGDELWRGVHGLSTS